MRFVHKTRVFTHLTDMSRDLWALADEKRTVSESDVLGTLLKRLSWQHRASAAGLPGAIPVVPLIGHATLSKLLLSAVPQFLPLENGIISTPTSWGWCRDRAQMVSHT